jgi:hypothetical protein
LPSPKEGYKEALFLIKYTKGEKGIAWKMSPIDLGG